jgi:Flp pilus assembly protein TadG
MTSRAIPHADDRGAVLIFVAVVLVGLLAMATFVVDFGMFWVARQQAQNAADAAAYGAAIALAQDTSGDRTDAGAAKQTALGIAARNPVWGEPPSVVSGDITFPTCPLDGTDMCVRVAVYRNQARGNPLPTVFGRLVGLTTQDVQAVATAEVRPGNINKCLKPWAVPDRWTDVTGSPTTFEKYVATPPKGVLLSTPDLFAPPGAHMTGSGYRLDRDLGTQLTLHQNTTPPSGLPCTSASNIGSNAQCQAQIGNFLPINFTPGCPGSGYLNAIVGCPTTCTLPASAVTVALNQDLTYLPGSQVLQTTTGVNTLKALDPDATFNPVTKRVENSCVGGGGIPYTCSQPGFVESPRIVAVPAYDVSRFDDGRQLSPAHVDIRVTNILSVFIDGMNGNDVTTHIVAKSGAFDSTKGVVTGGSAFTRTLLIVR